MGFGLNVFFLCLLWVLKRFLINDSYCGKI